MTCTSTLGLQPPEEVANVGTRDCDQLRFGFTMLCEVSNTCARMFTPPLCMHDRVSPDTLRWQASHFCERIDSGIHVPAIARAHDAVCCNQNTAEMLVGMRAMKLKTCYIECSIRFSHRTQLLRDRTQRSVHMDAYLR